MISFPTLFASKASVALLGRFLPDLMGRLRTLHPFPKDNEVSHSAGNQLERLVLERREHRLSLLDYLFTVTWPGFRGPVPSNPRLSGVRQNSPGQRSQHLHLYTVLLSADPNTAQDRWRDQTANPYNRVKS